METIERIRSITKAANEKWYTMESHERRATERTLISKLIKAYAENGCWDFTIDTLYDETVEWLQDLGFEVHIMEDDYIMVRWGNNYHWGRNNK